MAGRRIQRLNEQLKREITGLLIREVRDPRVRQVTITGVEVTADLWMARVFVTLQGDEAQRAEALEGLEAAAPFIRRALGRELRIRRVPELRFMVDTALERAHRIESLLREVIPPGESGLEQEPPGEGEPDGAPPEGGAGG